MLDLDPLLALLTLRQEEEIRQVFRRKRRPHYEADALIADWFRFSEVAHQHALHSYFSFSTPELLMSPPVRKRRDKQLRQATQAAGTAIDAINVLVEHIGRHSAFDSWFFDFQCWAETAVAHLRSTQKATEHYRLIAQAWPAVAKRRGTPRWLAESYRLEVLAAYFRNQRWRVAQTQTGLFAEVAFVVLGRRSSMNHARLKALANSCLDYEALEAVAPRNVEFAKPPIARKNPHPAT